MCAVCVRLFGCACNVGVVCLIFRILNYRPPGYKA